MRKNIALILALAMLFSVIVPMSASAASQNEMRSVPVVQDGTFFVDENYTDYEDDLDETTTFQAPLLRIVERTEGEWDNVTTSGFTLRTVENAKWPAAIGDSFNSGFDIDLDGTLVDAGNGDIQVRRINSSEMEFRLDFNSVTWATDNTLTDQRKFFQIPMLAEVDGVGDVRARLIDDSSILTSGTFTFAISGKDDTITTIDGVTKFTDTARLDDLYIRETTVGSFDADGSTMRFELPRNFRWDDDQDDLVVRFGGRYAGTPATTVSLGSVDEEGDGERGGRIIGTDRRVLEIDLGNVDYDGVSNQRGLIILENLTFTADRNARYGEVEMKVRGDLTDDELIVAERVDWLVSVTAEDPEEILSGYLPISPAGDLDDDLGDIEMAELTIKEEVEGAWLTTRRTEIDLPSWVSIVEIEVDTYANFDGGMSQAAFEEMLNDEFEKENQLDFVLPRVEEGKLGELTLIFYLTARADASGEITATVGGRSMPEEVTAVIGEAIAPVEVEVEPVDMFIGIQNQVVGDIVITESKAGALNDDGFLVLYSGDLGRWRTEGTITVDNEEDGVELDLDDVRIDGRYLMIPVTDISDEASTITISGAEITLDRNPAKGDYELGVGGFSMVRNNVFLDTDAVPDTRRRGGAAGSTEFFNQSWTAEPLFVTVVSPTTDDIDGIDVHPSVSFTVGQAGYVVGEESRMMDVAPYISNDRLMVPVRYLEDLFGAQPNWNATTRTVTVMFDGKVYGMEIGSNMITVNGAPYAEMDATAEITNDRTFVPASRFARAMGVEYEWDAITNTATFSR